MNEELKPCPFCGGQPSVYEIFYNDEIIKYGIECNDCKASTKLFTNRNYAVIVWNRRGWNAEKIEKEYINYE